MSGQNRTQVIKIKFLFKILPTFIYFPFLNYSYHLINTHESPLFIAQCGVYHIHALKRVTKQNKINQTMPHTIRYYIYYPQYRYLAIKNNYLSITYTFMYISQNEVFAQGYIYKLRNSFQRFSTKKKQTLKIVPKKVFFLTLKNCKKTNPSKKWVFEFKKKLSNRQSQRTFDLNRHTNTKSLHCSPIFL
eukprot:TRINITY_DN31397_c0_g1_i1.p3 TRINITY_DN31397_c0_g1~~TRINITY_DN31397_c0_g1_i1.p3  ORF type:complete len:189 (-),score=-21.29 TRINITY_DN31397_c0_g1_i1:3-569(-)